jgi:PAS domain S-box-containing protein
LPDDCSPLTPILTAFPQARGAMAERVRSFDWATTPLGDIAAWPQSLRTTVTLMLNARQPMFILWGPQRIILYNDAYAGVLGARESAALGHPAAEIWPEIYEAARDLIDPAFEGLPTFAENVHRVISPNGHQQEGWYTLSYTPIHDETGGVGGVFATVTDTSEHVQAGERLRFLLHLSEQLRACSDPVEITHIAARELALHLGVDRAGYGEIDDAQEVIAIHRDWTAQGVRSLAGKSRSLADYGAGMRDDLRDGRFVRIDDVFSDPRTAGQDAMFERIGVRAMLNAPLIRDGRFDAILFLHQTTPRVWTAGDQALAEDVAARTWSALTRARAEAALREQEERLRLVQQAGEIGSFDWDMVSGRIHRSPEYLSIQGIDGPANGEFTDDWVSRIHPEDRARVQAQFLHDRTHPGHFELEYRIIRPSDGQTRWLYNRGVVVADPEGRPCRLVSAQTDITGRKLAEAALQESESRFRAMADQAPAPIWMTSATGELEFANQAFGEYAGAPSDSLLGNVWIQMLHPDDLPNVLAARASARLHLEAYSFEARFRRSDGAWRTMLASAKPRLTAEGVFQGYVGLAIDLTEMRAAEAAMRESEARFRLLAESAPVMLWMGDDQGRCVYLNRSLRDFWGVPEDLAGFTWDAMLLEEDGPALMETFRVAMDRQEAFEVEARYRRPNGAIRTLFTRAEPRHDAEGRFIGMIGVNVDVTEARRAEQHQQLLINELNHRVKNTLATVQSIAHQTLRGDAAKREARDLLTARLLALSAAHDVLTRESWEGADIVEVVAAALRPYDSTRYSGEGAAHRVGPRAALAISMALHELATNALKYGALSGNAGQVRVSWTPTADGGLTLTWREEGGPPVVPPTRMGFGSRLLRQGLTAELGGRADLRFEPEGLICVIQARALD